MDDYICVRIPRCTGWKTVMTNGAIVTATVVAVISGVAPETLNYASGALICAVAGVNVLLRAMTTGPAFGVHAEHDAVKARTNVRVDHLAACDLPALHDDDDAWSVPSERYLGGRRD